MKKIILFFAAIICITMFSCQSDVHEIISDNTNPIKIQERSPNYSVIYRYWATPPDLEVTYTPEPDPPETQYNGLRIDVQIRNKYAECVGYCNNDPENFASWLIYQCQLEADSLFDTTSPIGGVYYFTDSDLISVLNNAYNCSGSNCPTAPCCAEILTHFQYRNLEREWVGENATWTYIEGCTQ